MPLAAVSAVAVLIGGLGLMIEAAGIPGWLASVGLVGMILSGVGSIGRFCGVIVGIGVSASAVIVVLAPDGADIVMAGIGRASLFGALICAIAFLQEAARTSRLVVDAGSALVARRGRMLFPQLFMATHTSGLVLNFGAVTMLSPLVEAATCPDREPALRRRLYLALLRGFVTTTMWSPFTVAYLATLIVVPTLDGGALAVVGLGTALLFFLLGIVFDWLDRLRHSSSEGGPQAPVQGQAASGPLLRLGGVVVLILFAAWAGSWVLNSGLLAGLLLTAPFAGAIWAISGRSFTPLPRRMLQYLRSVSAALPSQAGDVAVLGGTAYLGHLAAVFAADLAPGGWLEWLPWIEIAVPVLAAWFIILLGIAGVGPLISLFAAGALIGSPEALGIPPLLLGVALMAGWSICVSVSPAGAALRVVARSAGVSTSEVSIRWNGTYSLAGALLLPAWLVVVWQFV